MFATIIHIIVVLLQSLLGSVSALMLEASIIHVADTIPEISLVSYPHIPATIITPSLTKDLSQVLELRHGGTEKPVIALTFDDGLDPDISQEMLDILREKNVKCTFFLTGKWLVEEKELTRMIIADGHEMGNHSFNHPDFKKISGPRIRQEIQNQENTLVNEYRYLPKPYFRFPYGSKTEKILKIIHQMGYTSIAWNIDTLDWKSTKEYIVHEALTKAENGAIIIMHLGKENTAKALPEIIDGLRQRGFELVTISTLLEYDPSIPRPSSTKNS